MSQPAALPVTVQIQYFGLIRDVVPVSEQSVTLPVGATVRDVLSILSQQYGPRFLDALFAGNEQLLPNSVIALNTSNILHKQGMDTPIAACSSLRILLMPAVAGGG
jgi:molybdopterin converting factor small subunit